jgi:hypothetical protein
MYGWFDFANKLLKLGYDLGGNAGPAILKNDDRRGDIRLITVSLIARSLSNMRGVLIMVQEKRLVEAKMLARSIIENQFWIGGFAQEPDKFRKAIIEQDLNRRGANGQLLFQSGDLSDEVEQQLRQWMNENAEWRAAKSITPKDVARAAQQSDAYIFYANLSLDAHPTVHSLRRYVVADDNDVITDVDLDPAPPPGELASTLGLACFGLVNSLLFGCEILQSGVAMAEALAQEYLALMRSDHDGGGRS